MRPDGTDDHRVALRNGGSGLAWTPDGKALVYGELQVHRTFSVLGDLSLVDVASGRRAPPHPRRARLRPRRLAGRPDGRLRAEAGGPLGAVHGRPRRRRPQAPHRVGRGRRVERAALEPARRRHRGLAPPARRLARPRARRPGDGRGRAAHPRPGEGRGADVDARRGGRRLPLRPRRRLEPPRRCASPTARSCGSRTSSAGRSSRRSAPTASRWPTRPTPRAGTTSASRRSTSPRRPAAPPFAGRSPGPAPRPAAGRLSRRSRTVPGRCSCPRFWSPWVAARRHRGPLRPRHRRLGRPLPTRLGRAGDVRDAVRARQRERLLRLRPLPPHVPGERAGHDGRLRERPAPHAPGGRAGVAAAPPHRPLHPDALGDLAAGARGGAGQRPARRPPRPRRHRDGVGAQHRPVVPLSRSRRAKGRGCGWPGSTRPRPSAASSRSTS